MLRPALPGWQPSTRWAVRWVSVYVGLLVAAIVVGATVFGTRGRSMFGPEWQGTSAAWHQAESDPAGRFLLSADEAPHVDPGTGLPVGRWANFGGANATDRAYATGWNRQMRARLTKSPAPRRFDATDADGASILRRFEARAADVVEVPSWTDPEGLRFLETAFTVGGVSVVLGLRPECMVPRTITVRGRDVAFPGSASVRRIGAAGRLARGSEARSWLPCCASYRALLSDDARTLWLAGPEQGSDDRAATWTAAIDVATGFTVGVDFVEGR